MAQRETVFLTADQALRSIRRDLRQYDPQVMLLCQILRLISGGKTVVRRDPNRDGAWISTPARQNMRWLGGPELVETVCESLEDAHTEPEMLASVCGRVFHARAYTALDPETGQVGIRVETGMDDFHCRQCGRCCRSLDYRKEVTAEDVARWRTLGRTDILDWVGIFERAGRETAYRIWMIPGTTKTAETCPFLHHVSEENRWICRIHDVKPAICRQYPFTRKHALMTGCPGFQRSYLKDSKSPSKDA